MIIILNEGYDRMHSNHFLYRIFSLTAVCFIFIVVLSGCTSEEKPSNNKGATDDTEQDSGVVNLYTSRHYDTDAQIYKEFEEQTGIKVNVVEGKADELIVRLAREGEATEADVYITADAGRLSEAKKQGLLQPVESEKLNNNIPENVRDRENQWFGISKRARVIVYSKERVDPSELSTYEALTEDKWKGKVLVRSSENVYNQSLLASFIEINGEEAAKDWAIGIVENMARNPQGGDRDQAKGIASGEGDVAIMNTYYVGQMLNSSDEEEVKVAEQVGVFFPNQDSTGTHINVSGAAVTKHANNKENAIKFLEFLSEEQAQKKFAESNYEYPVNPKIEPSELLQSWGEFKEQEINLSVLGDHNLNAIKILNEVGWK